MKSRKDFMTNPTVVEIDGYEVKITVNSDGSIKIEIQLPESQRRSSRLNGDYPVKSQDNGDIIIIDGGPRPVGHKKD
jgi:hypothetical protein